MNSDKHEPVSGDSDLYTDFDLDKVEISDIPAMGEDNPVDRNGMSSTMVKLGTYLPKRRRTWRWLMGAATFSLLLGLLFSNLSAFKASVLNLLPAPTTPPVSGNSFIMLNPTANPEGFVGFGPDVAATGRFVTEPMLAAPAPQDCVAAPTVTSSREIGVSPVWLYGFDGPQATMHLRGQSEPIVHNVYGWPVFIQLMVKNNFTQSVTLSGGNLRDTPDAPNIFFAFYPGERPMDSILLGTQDLVVNPIHPEVGQKAVWIATMFLFSSGCYYLKATWPGGQWTIHFAAGR